MTNAERVADFQRRIDGVDNMAVEDEIKARCLLFIAVCLVQQREGSAPIDQTT